MLKEHRLKLSNQKRRAIRTRSRFTGTAERPRLSISVSNKNVIAQIINDAEGKTLAYVTTVSAKAEGSMTAKAEWVGKEIAKQATTRKIKHVVLDRGDKKYHARLKALADAARSAGLEF